MGNIYNRSGINNPNWQGGICDIKCADDLLFVDDSIKEEVRRRLITKRRYEESTGCWIWTGDTFKSNGRACLTLGVRMLAYRLSYVLEYGSTNGLCVFHDCDNILCINPDHLSL